MATNIGKAGSNEHQLHGENSDSIVESDDNEHEKIGKQGIIPKVEEKESDEEMDDDDEGDVYKIISNVKVTINEKVDGTVNPLPEVSKTKDVKFEDYEFEDVDMKDETGVKEEDGLLTPKIEPSNPEDMGPNLLKNIVLGFLQNSNTEESKPSLEQTELICSYCLKQFSKRSALMCHVKDVHEKNGDFACGYCEKRFYRKSALIDHERKHTGEKPFVCFECGKAYDRKSYLNIHMQMHGERYPCGICEKTFSLKKNLGKHIKYVHEKVKNFCCETCSKTFGRSEHLKRHIEDMHGERGDYVHKCEQCDSTFRKEDQLKAHMRYVHNNEKNFVCDTCAKAFPIKASLDRHIADVHEQSGSHQCQFCEKRFYKPHALKIHERKHTQEKPFACGFCDKKYHRAMDKDAHERKHTGEKPFHCETCGASFRSQALKRYHMKSHVEVLKQEDDHFDPNMFNGINSALSILTNLNTQSTSASGTISTQSEEKPHQSEICDENFQNQALKQDQMNSSVDKSQVLKQDHINSHADKKEVLKQDPMNSPVDKSQLLKRNQMNSHGDRSCVLSPDHKNSHEDRSQVLEQYHMNSSIEKGKVLNQDHMNSRVDGSYVLNQDHKNSHEERNQVLEQDQTNSHVDESHLLKQDHKNSHEDKGLALKKKHMHSHVDRGQVLNQDRNNSHEERSQALKKDHLNSHVDKSLALKQKPIDSHLDRNQVLNQDHKKSPDERSQVLKPDHMNFHEGKSHALNQDHKSSHEERSHVLQQDHTSSHVHRSQALKQEHMNSYVENLKRAHAQFDPSVLQPNFYNAFNLPIMNNQSAQPSRSPFIPHTEEKMYANETFKSQTIRQDPMKAYEEALKNRSAQYDPYLYNTLFSPHPLVNNETIPNTTHTEKPFQCEKGDERFRSQTLKQYHMQPHEEVPKNRNAQFYPSVPQPDVYNPFNSALPLMKKQTAMYRSSQGSTSTGETPFQCEAEKQYFMKSHPAFLKQGCDQFVPSVVQPHVYNSSYSPQPKLNHHAVEPGNRSSTNQ